jgi:hypothetical protein
MFGDYERRFIVPIKMNRMTRHQAAEDNLEGGIGRLSDPKCGCEYYCLPLTYNYHKLSKIDLERQKKSGAFYRKTGCTGNDPAR